MRDNSQRAKLAMIMIWVVTGINALMAVSSYLQVKLLNVMAAGESVSDQQTNMNDMREAIIAGLYTIAYIVSVVTFIQWFRRAYFNLHTKVKHLEFTEGWAAGSWFVPILNLFRPYQIMKELYENTHRLLKRGGEPYASANLTFVNLWWGLWVIVNIAENAITRLSLKAETVEALTLSSQASMITSLLGLPLGILAVRVISDYAAMESRLALLSDNEERPVDIDFGGDDDILDAVR